MDELKQRESREAALKEAARGLEEQLEALKGAYDELERKKNAEIQELKEEVASCKQADRKKNAEIQDLQDEVASRKAAAEGMIKDHQRHYDRLWATHRTQEGVLRHEIDCLKHAEKSQAVEMEDLKRKLASAERKVRSMTRSWLSNVGSSPHVQG